MKLDNLDPVIKWTGSKRLQAEKIIDLIPRKDYNSYYEPFCGGCSILYRLLNSIEKVHSNNQKLWLKEENWHFDNYYCSDINKDLIAVYNIIKTDFKDLLYRYDIMHNELSDLDNIDDKRNYFNSVRDRYNKTHDPIDFFFIMRTTTNGMPRYNKNGEFNNSFHLTRNGMNPDRISWILGRWYCKFKIYDVQFESKSYDEIQTTENDFMYLDPPYYNTKGIYYGTIDYTKFWEWLRKQPCKWILSFDGKNNKGEDFTYNVPEDLYKKHIYLDAGNSSFRRLIGKSNDTYVKESLYLNYEI